MATSGSVDFTATKIKLIQNAFQAIGEYGRGRTLSADDYAQASDVLNYMIKAWQIKDVFSWKQKFGFLFLTRYQDKYSINSTGAYACDQDDAVITQLDGALATSATAVTVDSTVDMAASDNIGIVVDDGTLHWDTIASVDTSTTLTLTTGVDDSASDNAKVFTFTNKLDRPLDLFKVQRVTGLDSGSTSTRNEVNLTMLDRDKFINLPQKTTNGTPNQYYISLRIDSMDMYLWPRPDNVSHYLSFSYDAQLEDMDANSDNFDFPAEWLEALKYGLAFRLAPEYGRADLEQSLGSKAITAFNNARNSSREMFSITLEPDMEGY